MDLDEIYIEIGEFGSLQMLYFFSLALFNFYPPFNMIQVVFTGQFLHQLSFLNHKELYYLNFNNQVESQRIRHCIGHIMY